MAVESKPLFHPEAMRQQVRALTLPEHVPACQPKLQHWTSLIASGRADEFKETELLPGFLTDIFCGLLGYTDPADKADTYILSRERHVEADGMVAEAVRPFGILTKRCVNALRCGEISKPSAARLAAASPASYS
jgi:hypothetical protein